MGLITRHPYAEGATMTDVTRILSEIEQGDPAAAEQLLPLVYEELRKLASQRLVNEKPGQTLQATALVHEAYLRLLGSGEPVDWNGRRHFFGPQPKRCDGSWSRMRGESKVSNRVDSFSVARQISID